MKRRGLWAKRAPQLVPERGACAIGYQLPLNPRSHSSTGLFVTTVRTPTRQRGMDWSSIAALDPCVWIVGGGGIPMRRNCKWARVRPKWQRHHNIRTGIETGGRAKGVMFESADNWYWWGLSATRSLPNDWYGLLNGECLGSKAGRGWLGYCQVRVMNGWSCQAFHADWLSWYAPEAKYEDAIFVGSI